MTTSTKLPTPREAQVQSGILAAARALGIVLHPTDAGAYRRATRGARGGPSHPKGWPDLSGHVPAHRSRTGAAVPIYLEVKRPGEKPGPEQRQWLDVLARDGAAVAWFDSVGEAFAWLQELVC